MVDEVLPADPKRRVSAEAAQRAPNEGRHGRTLGEVVETFGAGDEAMAQAYERAKALGPDYCISGFADGWCVRKWISIEVA
jgi:hypothetical protein